MKTFSGIYNKNFFTSFGQINEDNAVDWFSKFLTKTSNFLDIWIKKGNSKYKIDLSKGKIQSNNTNIQLDANQLKRIWSTSKLYKKCYPKTSNFINHNLANQRPDTIDKNDWENIIVKMYVYTPEINYDGENYPSGVGIYPQKKIELIKDYFTIQSFETSTLIANKEIQNKIFEFFIDELIKNVGTSFKGIVLYTPNPSSYNVYQYHGHKFETIEIKDDSKEDKDKPKEEVDKNKKSIQVLKMDF